MKQQLLLLEDVDGVGRKGEIGTAKPGFVRNYLLPQKKAVIADANTLKMQAKLKAEREKQSVVDRKESEELAKKLEGVVLSIEVKTDTHGKMYGSVSLMEVAQLLQAKEFKIERKQITLPHPIKSLGTHTVPIRLKEGVEGTCKLEVTSETPIEVEASEVVAEIKEEPAEEETPEA